MNTHLTDTTTTLALPAELTGITLPNWAGYLAQDADGTWWAYEADPNQHHQGWYENEVGRSVRLIKTEANIDWRETLLIFNQKDYAVPNHNAQSL